MKSIIVSILMTIIVTVSLFGQIPIDGSFSLTDDSKYFMKTNVNSFALHFDQIQDSSIESNYAIKGRKSPGLAFALSLIFPGAGQYYNGDVGKGLSQDALVAVGLVLVISEANKEGQNSYYGIGKGNSTLKATGIAMVLGASLWSIIDAPISASKKNKLTLNQSGHLYEINEGSHIIGIDLGFHKSSIGSKLTYHF